MLDSKTFLRRMPFELTRFAMLSGFTFAIDFAVFSLGIWLGFETLPSLLVARVVAILVNLTGAKLFVFHSQEEWKRIIPRFLALCAVHTLLSYWVIVFFQVWISSVLLCRIIADLGLFFLSFVIQKRWIF